MSTRPTIDDAETVIDALESFEAMQPDGTYRAVEVETNRADDNPPNVLRVAIPRKATCTSKVIDTAREHGLYVADGWQHDHDKEADVVMFMLKPREPSSIDDTEQLQFLVSRGHSSTEVSANSAKHALQIAIKSDDIHTRDCFIFNVECLDSDDYPDHRLRITSDYAIEVIDREDDR